MIQSLFKKSDPAAEMIQNLRLRCATFQDQPLEFWGPVEAFQYDTAGSLVIQKYRTLLVRLPNDQWYFVRSVIDVEGRTKSRGVDYVSQVPESEARRWLKDHVYCRRRTMAADRSVQPTT